MTRSLTEILGCPSSAFSSSRSAHAAVHRDLGRDVEVRAPAPSTAACAWRWSRASATAATSSNSASGRGGITNCGARAAVGRGHPPAGAAARRGAACGLDVAADDAAARARCPGSAAGRRRTGAAILRASGEAFTRPARGRRRRGGGGRRRRAAAGAVGDRRAVVAGTDAVGSSMRRGGGPRAGGRRRGGRRRGASAAGAGAAAPPARAPRARRPRLGDVLVGLRDDADQRAHRHRAARRPTRILRRTPAPKASISTLALSVSTSARMSPPLIAVAFLLQPLDDLAGLHGLRELGHHHLGDPSRFRHTCADAPPAILRLRRRLQLLEVLRVRHRRVLAGDPLDRRVEIVEGLLGDDGRDLGAHAGEARARLHHHRAVGLPDGADDRLRVHRPQRARIDDLDRDAVLGQLLRRPPGRGTSCPCRRPR